MLNELFVLQSYVTNYPIISSFGLALGVPIAIVTERKCDIQQIANLLSLRPVIVDTASRLPKIREVVYSANSQGVFLILTPRLSASQKGRDIIDLMLNLARMQGSDRNPCRAVPIYVCNHCVPDYVKDDVFELSFNEEILLRNRASIYSLLPSPEDLPVIFDKITTLRESSTIPVNGLVAAACFLYPSAKKNNLQVEQFLDAATRLNQQNASSKQNDGFLSLFLDTIYEWQERTGFSQIASLPNLDIETVNAYEKTVFHDEINGYAYFSEHLFREITEPLQDVISPLTLKRLLAEAGILLKGERTRYTSHMPYTDICGNYKRIRMLRFASDSLCRQLDAPFVDLCKITATKGDLP